MQSSDQPQQKPAVKGLFPTLATTDEVVELAKSKLPVEYHNDMLCMLMCYHNTLLSEISKHEKS